ncbi:hypothetical protein JNJ66_02505 [Candidatus Saccharibacteria bacterium]|nr:hypothetical protein [Candidatus Saccharibacteria bacterium]
MAAYSDNFNRPDSTSLGNWSEIVDDWSIVGNQLAPGLSTTGVVLYGSQLDTPDHYVEVTVTNASTSSMGVVARSDISGNDFYLFRNNGFTWTLFRNVGGSFNPIGAEYTAAAVSGDMVRLECTGSTIRGYVNGIVRVTVTDTLITTGRYAGVRSTASSTTRYDNFTAADTGVTGSADPGAFFEIMF